MNMISMPTATLKQQNGLENFIEQRGGAWDIGWPDGDRRNDRVNCIKFY
jgi:hypothetical protein